MYLCVRRDREAEIKILFMEENKKFDITDPRIQSQTLQDQ
jgi:hypothetical protein